MMVRVTVEQALSAALKDIKTRLDRVERRSFSALGLTEHNGLGGIQGGALTERYHLTLDETSRLLTASEYAQLQARWTVVTEFTFTAIQAAIDAASSGDTIFLPSGTYYPNGATQIDVNKSLTIRGEGATTLLYQNVDLCKVFEVTASYVNIVDLAIRGPQYTVYQSDYGIRVMGGVGAWLNNFHIENVRMFTFGHSALWMQYLTEFSVINCEVFQVQRSGIIAVSGIDGLIHGNHVYDLNLAVGNPNHYPIAVTRLNVGTNITDSPRSENIVISGNKVEGASWEAIETHGGKDLVVVGNIVRNCKIGVAMVPCPDSGGTDTYAPLNCTVVGNVIDSQVTDGSKQVGIKFIGPTNSPVDGGSVEFATGSIVGNTVINYGDENNVSSGAIQIYGTKGMNIHGNTIVNPSPVGISVFHTNRAANITGNTIVDVWSNGYANPSGIYLTTTGYNECFIGGNIIDDTGDGLAGKTYALKWGVFSGSTTTNKISWGQNRIAGYTAAETYLGNTIHTHGFTGMDLVANAENPMFGLGRATAATGFPALTSTTTGAVAFRTLTAGTGISITNPAGVAGNPVITATGTGSPDLTGSTGIVAQTGSTTYSARTITGSGQISVSNGSGVSGNPTISWTAPSDGAWTSFTPGWFAVTANPSLGNGTITGLYRLLASDAILMNVQLTMGSTTTYGTGNWWFTLNGTGYTISVSNVFGSGIAFDSSGSAYYQAVPLVIAADRVYVMSGAAAAQSYCAAAAPFTWATSDTLKFSIVVRV